METIKIIELLREKNVTQVSIADELGVRQPAVNQVIHKRQTSKRNQDKICEKINRPFDEVWKKTN